jgi:hypothetical protein
MGAPSSGVKAAEQPAAETLLTAFKTIDAAERRRHASVLNYWLSIRGDKEFPPLHDLDPLELSDAGPNSGLFELISGGHDAEIRHLGEALRDEDWPERIMDAPSPSLLACIAKKLPIVAISRDFLAFEDDFEGPEGKTRCWVTLLPLSAGGAWVDYVYALVSLDKAPTKASAKKKVPEADTEAAQSEEPVAAKAAEPAGNAVEECSDEVVEEPVDEINEEVGEANGPEPLAEAPEPPAAEAADEEQETDFEQDDPEEPAAAAVAKAAPGFSKLLDSLAGLTGFYGSQPVKVDPVIETEKLDEEPARPAEVEEPFTASVPAPEEPIIEEEVAAESQPDPEPSVQPSKQSAPVASEGSLQSKLAQVRAEADEARQAKLRANAALYEALSAAYDFALDAEESPEEYLRLVEAQGLKIQLRSPMKPVVKLAFEGMCDEPTIKQLEAVLAWAFDEELPRGALAEKIEASGGIGPILGGQSKAA